MKPSRLPKWATWLLVGAFLVTGCTATQAPQTPETGAPAAQETAAPAATEEPVSGEITVYTALEDDQIAVYLPLFEAKYPNIKVNIVRDSTGIITAKLLAEKDNPQADVVWGLAASSLLIADQMGMLEPYAPAGLERIRPSFRDEKNPPHWVGIDAWFSAFCVNTVELQAKNLPMPTSWADLIKPEYKGLIVMPNPNSSGTGYLSVSAILQLKGEEEGWKYLDALHENIAVYTHSGSKPCKMAGAGETVIGISFDYRAIKQKAEGQPIEPVFPKEGSGWEIEANALIKKPEIKPAARLFLDWAISPEAMEKYAASYPITAAETSVPIPEGYPADPVAQLIKNDFNWAAANRERILNEWLKRYDAKSEPK
ncbi:MAG: putative 2-aminoethylphosphonate ABC transporter substrate-binding protein [Anaerolineales bacterium]|nr:putative 2-aminoethylphosphonate ABC transporter substrate-binding protein [Anaerolineales bacterium]MCS7247708.1 putative 2-aminoethylphosphonate ABC transporter substrate-binding protein [Anaerolineales bacterium]MDW8161518.1 putative 2-aminoethylphosphonate ABC transporter substrate-binding protein [Anaerolineales bacterium]MDW8446854.1 putative 2-aminoethylphosphonate ABC transporter substrate-binding protein [Anaerolineales bacterium]